ncbi:MAG: hypothetical protein QOE92_1791, partial [Chloroflexota bacterium]|nr:hypothetical protein [Chloroflexota bacterium]
MTIPQLPLVVAFAIGLPLGIAGYFIQEALIRRRRRRAHAAVEAGSGWGAHGTAPAAGTRSGRATAVTGAGPPTAVATPQTAPPVATPAAPPVPGEGPTAPPAEKGAAYSSRRAGALRKQEADLTDAVEVLVDFIEAPPRRARAEAAAAAVAALVPKARRGVEL